jgi:dinuclear metal center YbgI/SA1388 family protein
VKIADLVTAMEQVAPTRLAASWDNVGLLVGDEGAPLARVLLAIDCTHAVVDEAVGGRFDAVVAYHPPLFEATKRFVSGSVAYACARAGVAVYSPHTAFDVVRGGTNDVLASALGILEPRALRAGTSSGAPPSEGLGRVGRIDPVPLAVLVDRVKRSLGVDRVLVSGALDRVVDCAATCAGSGADLIPDAIAAGAQLLLTGEVRHHDALRAAAAHLSVIVTRHSTSERCALPVLESALTTLLPGVTVARSTADRDPFVFV